MFICAYGQWFHDSNKLMDEDLFISCFSKSFFFYFFFLFRAKLFGKAFYWRFGIRNQRIHVKGSRAMHLLKEMGLVINDDK